jgi:hypothetical protein
MALPTNPAFIHQQGNQTRTLAFTPIPTRGMIMETPHTETVVEKTVAFVKEVLGIHPTPGVGAQPDYHTPPDVTAENRREPRAYGTRVGELDAGSFVSPLGDPEDERLRRVVDGFNQEKTVKLNSESGRVEEARPDPDAFPTKSVAEVNDEIVRRENGV